MTVTTKQLDIVKLIEREPITRLSNTYQNNLLIKIKNEFSDSQQQLFLASFYCYLNYNSKTDYVIDLDDIWKWLGFSRKDPAKRVLEKNFTLDIDYLVQKSIPLSCGGSSKENILLNIVTFKKLCLKSSTKKADEIHDYFIKLEELLQETIDEENKELRDQVMKKDKELQQKEVLISQKEEIINQKDTTIEQMKIEMKEDQYIYIGCVPAMPNIHKIGITKHILSRQDAHQSSNPTFQYKFTYKTDYAQQIEYLIKFFMKPFKNNKPEWFNCNYDQIKGVLDFFVIVFEHYNVTDSVENLLNFASRFKNNKLTTMIPKSNTLFKEDVYRQFIDEHFVYNSEYKTPMALILPEFEKWIEKNQSAVPAMKTGQGNWLGRFYNELVSNIENITTFPKTSVHLLDKLRNFEYNNYPGFIGFELKSMQIEQDNCISYFEPSVYTLYVSDRLELDENKKLARTEIIKDFLDWISKNNFLPKNKIFSKNLNLAITFKVELKSNLIKNGLIYKDHISNGVLKNVCGFTNVKFKK